MLFDQGTRIKPFTLVLSHPARIQKIVKRLKRGKLTDQVQKGIPFGAKASQAGLIRIGRRRVYGLRALDKPHPALDA